MDGCVINVGIESHCGGGVTVKKRASGPNDICRGVYGEERALVEDHGYNLK